MDRDKIETITQRIVSHFNPRKVILFGSHARGAAGKDSDLDLCLEMETDLRPPKRTAAMSALFGLRTWPLDALVYTPEEAARLRTPPAPSSPASKPKGKSSIENSRMVISPHYSNTARTMSSALNRKQSVSEKLYNRSARFKETERLPQLYKIHYFLFIMLLTL